MENEIFVLVFGGLSFLFMGWGFRSLPEEKWQIAFTAPTAKLESGAWRGTNYTYYGAFQALALSVAAALLYVLLSALDVRLSPLSICGLITAIVAVSFTASRAVARVVEGKAHTSTVAGAFFAGFLVAPWLIAAANRLVTGAGDPAIPVIPVLAAAAAAYNVGEGLGRLSCISFGCCYGKPVSRLHPFLQRLCRGCGFRFHGNMKKAAYEGNLEDTPVVPVQAMTSVLLVTSGLVATYLFLRGLYAAAFLLAIISSQAWRGVSEALRADYRGKGRFSAYQVMAILAVPYALCIWALFSAGSLALPDIATGVKRLWSPAPILFFQALGMAIFLATGRSSVTGSFVTMYVRHDRV